MHRFLPPLLVATIILSIHPIYHVVVGMLGVPHTHTNSKTRAPHMMPFYKKYEACVAPFHASFQDMTKCPFVKKQHPMHTSNKIALILTIRGNWPAHMMLWLHRALQNTYIDFHIFYDTFTTRTQQRERYSISPNIYIHVGFSDRLRTVRNALGFPDINETNAWWVLCDLRPFNGMIYEKMLHDYEYWGWTDTDVIYGNLSSFYSYNQLRHYDVVGTGMGDRTSGPLSFFKNKPFITHHAPMKLPRHKYIRHEWSGLDESFQHVLGDARLNVSYKNTEASGASTSRRYYKNGRIFEDGDEKSYYHWGGRSQDQKKIFLNSFKQQCKKDCFPATFRFIQQ